MKRYTSRCQHRQLLLLILLGVSWFYAQSQQIGAFHNWRIEGLSVNPAALSRTFLTHEMQASLFAEHRNQWTGIEEHPVSQSVGGDYFWVENRRAVNLSLGGLYEHETAGPLVLGRFGAKIGGVLSDDPYSRGLALGLSFGLLSQRIAGNAVHVWDAGDFVPFEDRKSTVIDAGFGVFAFQKTETGWLDGGMVYGGFSVQQLFGSVLQFRQASGDLQIERTRHFFANAGWRIPVGANGTFLEPTAACQLTKAVPANFSAGLQFQGLDLFWFETAIYSSRVFSAGFGLLLGERVGWYGSLFRLGYNFENSFREFGGAFGGGHQLRLMYSFSTED